MMNEIPPIVLLLDSNRDMLDAYSRHLEGAGFWVAATTVYDELIASAEDLHPDVIIADTDVVEGDSVAQAVDAVRQHPDLAATPLVVLVSSRAEVTPNADITLRKPVPPEFLLRRTREILGRSRELRGRSNDILKRTHTLVERSQQLTTAPAPPAIEIDATRRACPKCSAILDWVERGTIGGVTYDYFRWCPKGCGLYCYNRDAQRWIKLA